MKLTKATEYGILTLLYLAKQPEGQLSDTARIAEVERIPSSFLGKLVPLLVKAGLVRSHRGSHGGIALGRPADTITLRQVVEATEGEIAVNDCTASTPHDCFRTSCAVQAALLAAQQQFMAALEAYTLEGLARRDGIRHASFDFDLTPTP
ncbi:MAG TPA: Rrf2 family transcriptional regulator [Pantanalinema sp.]